MGIQARSVGAHRLSIVSEGTSFMEGQVRSSGVASSRSTRRPVGPGPGDHGLERHRLASLTLALVGRLHEGEELDRLLGGDRRLAGPEKLADCDDQRLVARITSAGDDTLGAEDGCPIIRRTLAQSAERANSASFPDARYQVRSLRMDSRDRLAAGTHDGVERLDPVDPVPEKVGMMLLEMARAVGIAADHVTHLGIVLHPRDPWAEPERRARKARSA